MRVPLRILPVAVAALLFAAPVVAPVAAQETPDPEPLTPIQRRALQKFTADGILEGTSCSFADCSGSIERWEVALWIIRLFNYEPMAHESFADVDPRQPYADYIETLYDREITVGCLWDPLRFCPVRYTTRGQMAAFVTRAYDLNDTETSHGYRDVPPTHVFADNITALKNSGVVSEDCDRGRGLFCPNVPIVAAAAVEWLYRASLIVTTIDGDRVGAGGGSRDAGNGAVGNIGGGNFGDGDPPPTALSSDIGGPGGPEIDIGPNGECTHWGTHISGDQGFDGRSWVLRTGNHLYAHRHDGTTLRWWYWPPPVDGEHQSPINLFEGDPRIPCHHAACPTDHVHDGSYVYQAGAHHFGEGSDRNRNYTLRTDGDWEVAGQVLSGLDGPCELDESTHSH